MIQNLIPIYKLIPEHPDSSVHAHSKAHHGGYNEGKC